jgi:hypothetical protein
MVRNDERAAERRDRVVKHLKEIFVPGVEVGQAILKLYKAFAAKGWKFETKDLTPELAEFADAYLRSAHAHAATYLDDSEDWLLAAHRWKNRDHARVAAINHFVKRCKDCIGKIEDITCPSDAVENPQIPPSPIAAE